MTDGTHPPAGQARINTLVVSDAIIWHSHSGPDLTTVIMSEFCLVPLDDKISVLENSIGVLEDIHNALQVKRDTVNSLICDLADLDGKTHRLMMHIQLMVLSLKKEVRKRYEGRKTMLT